MNWISGGFCGGVTPGSMPNPAVKPSSADGTAEAIRGRVGHCRKSLLNKHTRGRSPKGTPSRCMYRSLPLDLNLSQLPDKREKSWSSSIDHFPGEITNARFLLFLRLDYFQNFNRSLNVLCNDSCNCVRLLKRENLQGCGCLF